MAELNTNLNDMMAKLGDKIDSYQFSPDKRKHGDALLKFAESKEFVFLLADILRNNKIDEYLTLDELDINYSRDYWTFMHIFMQYIIHQKEGYQDILNTVEFAADKAIEVVMNDDWDGKYYILRCICNIYKKETNFPVELLKKFDIVPNDKLRFALPIHDDSAYQVRAYSDFTCGEVKIPSEYKGKPVKVIGWRGFESSGITSIELPEGIETIRKDAFVSTKIKKIVFPQSLKTIEEHAFSCCSKLVGDIVIPRSVTEMGKCVFQFSKVSKVFVEGFKEKPAGWHEKWDENFHIKPQKTISVIWNYSK